MGLPAPWGALDEPVVPARPPAHVDRVDHVGDVVPGVAVYPYYIPNAG